MSDNGFKVEYADDVTPDQIKAIDDLVRSEFDTGDWVVVESESATVPPS